MLVFNSECGLAYHLGIGENAHISVDFFLQWLICSCS